MSFLGAVFVCVVCSIQHTDCLVLRNVGTRDNGGCHYNGVDLLPGTQKDFYDDAGQCVGIQCTEDSRVILWTGMDCDQTRRVENSDVRNTEGCQYKGVALSPGTQQEFYDDAGHCTGIQCTEDSRVILWTGMDCDQNRRVHEETKNKRSNDVQCIHKGNTYAMYEVITSEYDDLFSMCYGYYCSNKGTVELWAEMNCSPAEMTSASIQNRKLRFNLGSETEVNEDLFELLGMRTPPKKTQVVRGESSNAGEQLHNCCQGSVEGLSEWEIAMNWMCCKKFLEALHKNE